MIIDKMKRLFLYNYDYLIVIGIILLSIVVLYVYNKLKKIENNNDMTNLTMRESSLFFGIFISIIMLCIIYLFFRLEGVIPNKFA